jgi:hypothetical protein
MSFMCVFEARFCLVSLFLQLVILCLLKMVLNWCNVRFSIGSFFTPQWMFDAEHLSAGFLLVRWHPLSRPILYACLCLNYVFPLRGNKKR